MPPTSINIVLKTSSVTVCNPRVVCRADLMVRIYRSQELPKCGAYGGLNRKLICWLASCDCRVGISDLRAFLSSKLPALKFGPWSDKSLMCFPCLAMKQWSAIKNESVSMLARRSTCTAWVIRHLNTMPHFFCERCPILILRNRMLDDQAANWRVEGQPFLG